MSVLVAGATPFCRMLRPHSTQPVAFVALTFTRNQKYSHWLRSPLPWLPQLRVASMIVAPLGAVARRW